MTRIGKKHSQKNVSQAPPFLGKKSFCVAFSSDYVANVFTGVDLWPRSSSMHVHTETGVHVHEVRKKRKSRPIVAWSVTRDFVQLVSQNHV